MVAKTVVLATIGSYGDLHPFMAAALALKARGVRPVIATNDVYRDKVEAEGIDFHPVRPSYEQIANDTGLSLAEFIATVLRSPVEYLVETITLPYLDQACEDLKPVIAAADLVVVSSFSLAATMTAEAFGKPLINAPLSPIVLMSDVDPPVLDALPSLPVLRRLLGPGFVRWVLSIGRWRLSEMNRRINDARARLGLPPTAAHALMDHHYQADEVVALYSSLMGAPPSSPPKPTLLAGFTAFDRDGQGGLQPEIEAFLEAGDPPLVFTLGSIAVLDGERFYADAAAAAQLLARRALLLVGREAELSLGGQLGARDILVAGYAPHSLIFPRAAAVIHHGGIGTTAQALRAGVPQLVCPIFGDQPDNAYRVRRLGVARSLDFTRVTPRRLASELARLLADPGLAGKAKAVARRLAGEDGAQVLAERIVARLAD